METVYQIHTEKQLDGFKKPRISFYSPKKTIRSLIALPEVKDDIRSLLKKGKTIEIIRIHDSFDCRVHDSHYEDLFGSDSLSNYKGKGFEMLNEGLKQMRYERADYNWTWIPPVVGIIIGGAIGATVGHYTEVFAGGTAGAIERAEIIDGLIGVGTGGGGGLLFDAVVAGTGAIKDVFEEPINRINLAKKVQKSKK
jgi:hypothetical protein